MNLIIKYDFYNTSKNKYRRIYELKLILLFYSEKMNDVVEFLYKHKILFFIMEEQWNQRI